MIILPLNINVVNLALIGFNHLLLPRNKITQILKKIFIHSNLEVITSIGRNTLSLTRNP